MASIIKTYHWNHEWEVKGHNARHYPERISPIHTRDSSRRNLQNPSLCQLRERTRPFDSFISLGNIGQGFRHVFPIFLYNQVSQFLRVLSYECMELKHNGSSGFHGKSTPLGKRILGSIHGGIHVRGIGYGHASDFLAVGWIVDANVRSRGWRHKLATNKVVNGCCWSIGGHDSV